MSDSEVVTAILESPFEQERREWEAVEAIPIDVEFEESDLLAALEDPRPFDEIPEHETIRRIRVGTDLTWRL